MLLCEAWAEVIQHLKALRKSEDYGMVWTAKELNLLNGLRRQNDKLGPIKRTSEWKKTSAKNIFTFGLFSGFENLTWNISRCNYL